MIYQVLTILTPLLTTPYISRVLGTEGVGEYSYAYSIANYFVMFALLGVNNYGNRAIAMAKDSKEKMCHTFWEIYCFQLALDIFICIVYSIYILVVCDNKTLGGVMILFVISGALDINWLFFGLEEFKTTVVRNIVIKLLSVACVFVFVKNKEDVWIYSLIYAGSALASQLFLWTVVKKYIYFVKPSLSEIKQHIKPNLVLFIPVLAISLYTIMDKIMLGMITNKSEVGYYESCERILQLPLGFINALGTVMLPRISHMLVNKQDEKTQQYLEKSLLFAMFLSSSISFGIMGVSREFVPLFFGDGFEKCIWVFQALMPSCLFLSFANVIRTQFLIPNKKDKVYVVSVIAGAVCNLIINALSIPFLGAIGASIGTLIAQAVVCFVQCFYIRHEIAIKMYLYETIPFLFAALIMHTILFKVIPEGAGTVSILYKMVIGMFSYFLIIVPFALWGVKRKESRKNYGNN